MESGSFIDTQTEEAWLSNIPKEFPAPADPAWSHDGRSLLYSGPPRDARSKYSMVRIDLNGQNPRFFADIPNGNIAISPDEKMAAFTAPFENDLYLMDLETGKMRLTKRTRSIEINPFWSPDGKWVGIEQRTEATMDPSKIYFVNVETGQWRFFIREHEMGFLSWWQPPTGPLPDCGKIVREAVRALAAPLRKYCSYSQLKVHPRRLFQLRNK